MGIFMELIYNIWLFLWFLRWFFYFVDFNGWRDELNLNSEWILKDCWEYSKCIFGVWWCFMNVEGSEDCKIENVERIVSECKNGKVEFFRDCKIVFLENI